MCFLPNKPAKVKAYRKSLLFSLTIPQRNKLVLLNQSKDFLELHRSQISPLCLVKRIKLSNPKLNQHLEAYKTFLLKMLILLHLKYLKKYLHKNKLSPRILALEDLTNHNHKVNPFSLLVVKPLMQMEDYLASNRPAHLITMLILLVVSLLLLLDSERNLWHHKIRASLPLSLANSLLSLVKVTLRGLVSLEQTKLQLSKLPSVQIHLQLTLINPSSPSLQMLLKLGGYLVELLKPQSLEMYLISSALLQNHQSRIKRMDYSQWTQRIIQLKRENDFTFYLS